MASNSSDRLGRLQMEDLGTARREHISTADDQHHRRIRLQDIEAGRLAYVENSDAQKLAIKNEAQLAGWANVYKTIGDTEDLEHLDPLLDGQTHRLALNATIREGGGQTHARTGSERHPGAASSIRAPRSRARGGGVIGTRGRGTRQGSLTSSTPNFGYRVVLPPTKPHLDPALDTSNDFYKGTRQGNASRKEDAYKVQNRQPSTRKPTPTISARRPMADYGRLISPPENFLAAARNVVVNTNTAGVTPTGAAKVSGDSRPEESTRSLDTAGASGHYSPLKVQEHAEFRIPVRPQAATRSGDPPVPFTTRSTSSQRQNITRAGEPFPLSLSSTVRDTASQEEGSASMSLESERSTSELVETQSHVKEQVTSGMPTPITVEKSSLGKYHAIGDDDSRSLATTNATDALLLDLSSTPPKQSLLGRSPLATAMMSPTLEDLQGLEFVEDLDLLQDPVLYDSAPMIQPIGSKSAVNLKRQIDILCELLESTSLSDASRENLKQCKDELEGKMNKHSPTDETKGKGVLFPDEHISQDVGAVAEPGGQSQSSLDLLDMQDTPMESVRLDITQSPSPQSRLNVTAPPFFPHMPYRSPANSISSESTCIPQTPCPHRRISLTEGHIIGDHLLPGRRRNSMVTGPDPLVAKQLPPGGPSEPRVKFTIPQPYSLTLPQKSSVMEAFRPDDVGENTQPFANPSPELQRSMHAPKPEPEPKPRTSALSGLETSRYAPSQSSRPLR
ncbi:hypothetical protein BO94DRAFT_511563 [Aspergillus sclerotioniger CBS 115572]|uniref:Uncharacterized protein n=1 Tax=Aspergillus sclerotioniger CBS 115572 TaxID=1450535 RepID=A0A317X6C8_9EURO|nr:hypothetical protein BO94DRAFT_511563 [Aspergillus sclerotioniger CBS 115572]PWY93721.1 hypothetical protein BO94DRAFT_511563 [Aspergillus sclerotioniger CBS 115572]